MPKVGVEPLRREQICRAAAKVIARVGFANATMRQVAEEAGVSTGMLNHYFANRQDLLIQTLIFVSERIQNRLADAIRDVPPGISRLEALLDAALEEAPEIDETWRLWINAYGEAVHLPELRNTMEGRLRSWYALVDSALEGLVPEAPSEGIPWSWRFDAVLNGLAIQALTSEASLDRVTIRDEVIRMLVPNAVVAAE